MTDDSKNDGEWSGSRRSVLKSGASVSILVATSTSVACGPEAIDGGAPDAGELDGGPVADAGGDDAGTNDAGTNDAGEGDAGTEDAGPFDAGDGDAGEFDAGDGDAGAFDAGADDAGFAEGDAGEFDGGELDGGVEDAGEEDAGVDDGHPQNLPLHAGFDLGVASGFDHADAPMVWTRLATVASLPVLHVAAWPLDDPNSVATETVDVAGLTAMGEASRLFVPLPGFALPGVRYGYCFTATGDDDVSARSDVGQMQVPAAAGDSPIVRIGVSSCTHYNATPYTTLDEVPNAGDLDAFLLLGDTVYADNCTTYADYQAYWLTALAEPAYSAIRRRSAVLATWDDHEVANNWNPETMNADRLAGARDSFFDHLPLARDANDPDRIWRSHRFGDTLEVIVLDCRSERLPSTAAGPDAQYVSVAQLDWLKDRLQNSPCTFKLIMNSVPITDLPLAFDSDNWRNFDAQRNDILSFIDTAGIDGALWVSGDVHFGAAGRVGRAGDAGAGQIEIIAGPGGQNAPNPLAFLCRAPQFEWAAARKNYATLEFDPAAGTVRARFTGFNGSLLADITYAIATS